MKQKIFTLLTALVLSMGMGWAQMPTATYAAFKFGTSDVISSGQYQDAAGWNWNDNKFIIVQAYNNKTKSSQNYCRLTFWVNDFTHYYNGILGPAEGEYYVNPAGTTVRRNNGYWWINSTVSNYNALNYWVVGVDNNLAWTYGAFCADMNSSSAFSNYVGIADCKVIVKSGKDGNMYIQVLLNKGKGNCYVTIGEPLTYNVSIAPNNSNYGYVSTEGGTYEKGSSLQVNATAYSGYEIEGWEDNGVFHVGNTSSYSISNISEAHTIVVRFKQLAKPTITATAPNGSISGTVNGSSAFVTETQYYEGSTIALTAQAKVGNYVFRRWEENSQSLSSNLTYNFTVGTTNRNIVAVYEAAASYNVTINNAADGTVSGATTGSYQEQTQLTLTATPTTAGYSLKEWQVTINGVPQTMKGNPLNIAVTGETTITPVFISQIQIVTDYGYVIKNSNIIVRGINDDYEVSLKTTATSLTITGAQTFTTDADNSYIMDRKTGEKTSITDATINIAVSGSTYTLTAEANSSSYAITITYAQPGTANSDASSGSFNYTFTTQPTSSGSSTTRTLTVSQGNNSNTKALKVDFYVASGTTSNVIPTGTYTIDETTTAGHVKQSPGRSGSKSKYTYNTSYAQSGSSAYYYFRRGIVEVLNIGNDNSPEYIRVDATNTSGLPITATYGTKPALRTVTLTPSYDHGTAAIASASIAAVDGKYYNGTVLTLSATPESGYRLKGWSINGGTAQTLTNNQLNIDGDKTIAAVFELIPYYAISTSATNGTITGVLTGTQTAFVSGESYLDGTQITLTVSPNDGYQFTNWSDNNTSNPRTITVSGSAKTYTAVIVADYKLTVASNDENKGTVSASGTTFKKGQQATLTATAKDGYMFVEWNDHNTTNPRQVTMNGDASYTATFKAKYQVTATSNDNTKGSVSVSPAPTNGYYYDGQQITLTATPANSLCNFVKWQKNGEDIQGSAILNVTVNANDTYTAVFDGKNVITIKTRAYRMRDNHATSDPWWSMLGLIDGYQFNICLNSSSLTGTFAHSKLDASSWIADHGEKLTITNSETQATKSGNYYYLTCLATASNGKAYYIDTYQEAPCGNFSSENPGNADYDGTSFPNCNITKQSDGSYLVKGTAGNSSGLSYSYQTEIDFIVDDAARNGNSAIKIPSGLYIISRGGEKGTVKAPASNPSYISAPSYDDYDDVKGSYVHKYYHQSAGNVSTNWRWFLCQGYVKVVNVDEQYYISVTSWCSYLYTANYTIGTAPNTLTGTIGDQGHVRITHHTNNYGDVVTEGGSINVYNGNSITLTAIPEKGYAFLHWADDETNTNAERSITVNGTATYTAVFEKSIAKHDVTFKVEGQEDVVIQVEEGEVPVYPNAEPTKESTVSTVYTFTGWNDGTTTYTGTLPAVGSSDVTYTAQFSESTRQYTVTIAPATGGTIEVKNDATPISSGTKVDYGTTLTVTATPATGYSFDDWIGDIESSGLGFGASQIGTITIDGDKTIGATFAIETYTLTMDACDGGTYSVAFGESEPEYTGNGDMTFNNIPYGTKVTLKAYPTENFKFTGWEFTGMIEPDAPRRAVMFEMDDEPESIVDGELEMANPFVFQMTEDVEYVATFESSLASHTLTLYPTMSAGSTGYIQVTGGGQTFTSPTDSEDPATYTIYEGIEYTCKLISNDDNDNGWGWWLNDNYGIIGSAQEMTITPTADVDLYAGFGLKHVTIEGTGKASDYNDYLNTMVHELEYARAFKAKTWSTMWMPFSIDVAQQGLSGKIYTLSKSAIEAQASGIIDVALTFHKFASGNINAGEPCLFYSTQAVTNFVFHDILMENLIPVDTYVGTGNEQVRFFGIAEKSILGGSGSVALQKSYRFLSSNVLYYPSVNVGVNMDAFRACFQIVNYEHWYGEGASSAPRMRIIVDDETVITEAETDNEVETRKYINDEGNLIIERNGTKYTANGAVTE